MDANTGSYEYKIQHRPGSNISNADALSHLPLMDQPRDCNIPILGDVHLLVQQVSDTIVTVNDIRKWTSKDMVFARVHHFHNTWLARFMSRGCVETSYFNRQNEFKSFLPKNGIK